MNDTVRITLLLGLAAGGTALAYAGGQPQSKDSEGVQQAIRFERAKDVAALRQARLEAERARKTAEPQSAAAYDDAVSAAGGLQAAIRFERAKNAADARQAHLEAKDSSEAANSQGRRRPVSKRSKIGGI